MLWLAARSLAARRLSTAVTGLGLLIATLGFGLLASTSQTAAAALSGDIAATWDTPYDLLVRPAGSVTPLEDSQGLVRPNYVSGLGDGGITLANLAAIRNIPSVAVAAPIAISGYAFWKLGGFGMTLPWPHAGDGLQVYRMTLGEVTDAGTSHLRLEVHYLVVASSGSFKLDARTLMGELTTEGISMTCSGAEVTGYPVSCWAPNQCFDGNCGPAEDPPGYGLEMLQPVLVAGIDPSAEAKLTGLDHCLVGGRYLRPNDVPNLAANRDPPGTNLPVVVSDRSFVDATMTGHLERAIDPISVIQGANPTTLTSWVLAGDVNQTVESLYQQYLPKVETEVDEWPLWVAGDVQYTTTADGGLIASATPPDESALRRTNFNLLGAGDQLARPPELEDTWFRQVRQRSYTGLSGNKYWDPVGTYDPTCPPGFNELAGGAGLEAYAVPRAQLSDGRYLLPNRSLAGYLNSPPVILTALDSAAWLADPKRFQGGPGKEFISAIRVRVAGLGSPDRQSERRLARVAADIREATGLVVDVVKGSSAKAVAVDLPGGKFGRPAMRISEGWSVKGVAVRFTSAVSLQNLALFAMALLAAGVLIGTTTYIGARRRRTEFGVLRALGWPTWRIGSLVIAEMAWLGLVVGLLTLVLAAIASIWLSAAVVRVAAAAALPLALGVGVLAAIPAAVATARGTALARMARAAKLRNSRPAHSVAVLGLSDMLRNWKVEALAAAAIIALGATLLGILVLIAAAFRGELDTTVLGADLAGRVRPFHFILAAMTIVIASLGAGQVVSLSYLERRPQLAVLRALGWSRWQLSAMIGAQAVAIGAGASVLSVLAVLAARQATQAAPEPTGLAIGAVLLAVLASVVLAAAVPVFQVYAGHVVDALREE